MPAMRHLRAAGLALGSLAAAWLVVWLVLAVFLPGTSMGRDEVVVALVLAGAVCADIARRQQKRR